MTAYFGLCDDDGSYEVIAKSEISQEGDLQSIAERIAERYLNFKGIVDKLGYATFVSLDDEDPPQELLDKVDACLEPILGPSDLKEFEDEDEEEE